MGRDREDEAGSCVVKLINQGRMCLEGRQGPLAGCTGDAVPLWLDRGCAWRKTSLLLPSLALLSTRRDLNQLSQLYAGPTDSLSH